MMIIEGLKKLRVLEKKMDKNSEEITQYSSMLSSERPIFGTESEQRKEVQQRIQSNQDLMAEYLKLKRRIEFTNLKTFVSYDGVTYSISDMLVIKRTLAKKMIDTFNALNDSAARSRQNRISQQPDGRPVLVERLYDERAKNSGLEKWHDLYDNVESRLEVINATTELVEEV